MNLVLELHICNSRTIMLKREDSKKEILLTVSVFSQQHSLFAEAWCSVQSPVMAGFPSS